MSEVKVPTLRAILADLLASGAGDDFLSDFVRPDRMNDIMAGKHYKVSKTTSSATTMPNCEAAGYRVVANAKYVNIRTGTGIEKDTNWKNFLTHHKLPGTPWVRKRQKITREQIINGFATFFDGGVSLKRFIDHGYKQVVLDIRFTSEGNMVLSVEFMTMAQLNKLNTIK